MPVRVPIQFAKPTMRLARPICDSDGKLVAGNGTLLQDRVIRLLRKMALQSLVVEDTDDVPSWVTIRPLRQDLVELEERFRREGPSRPLDLIRQAITRHLVKRAIQLDEDPALPAADGGSDATSMSASAADRQREIAG
jgi:hypothetical protein